MNANIVATNTATQNTVAIAVPNPDASIEEKLELIKRVCAPNATKSELELFIYTAKRYNLDPLLNEIWLIKTDNRTLIKVARDGYLKIAHSSGQFDGMASQIVTDEKGNTVKVVCEVYRKDMKHPFRYEALMKDFYNPKSQVWVKSPTAMLVKVAESHALKRAFKISGVVGDDFDTTEMLEEQKAVEHNATPHVVVQTAITPNHEQELATEQEVQELRNLFMKLPKHRREKALKSLDAKITKKQAAKLESFCKEQFISEAQIKTITETATANGVTTEDLLNFLKQNYDILSLEHITNDIFQSVLERLSTLAPERAEQDAW